MHITYVYCIDRNYVFETILCITYQSHVLHKQARAQDLPIHPAGGLVKIFFNEPTAFFMKEPTVHLNTKEEMCFIVPD